MSRTTKKTEEQVEQSRMERVRASERVFAKALGQLIAANHVLRGVDGPCEGWEPGAWLANDYWDLYRPEWERPDYHHGSGIPRNFRRRVRRECDRARTALYRELEVAA